MKPISKLLYKKIIGDVTADDQASIDKWKTDSEAREALYRRVTDNKEIGAELRLRALVNRDRAEADMERRIKALEAPAKKRRRVWIYIGAAAASALLFFGIFSMADNEPLPTAETFVAEIRSIEDIRHGVTMATLSTDNGTVINLTDADSSYIAEADILRPTSDKIKDLCLDVPRGAEFKIMLEDSTEVWLNSASSLHYPEKFGQKERRVKISGEAYFVVAMDSLRPFYVETDMQVVRVYGTRFNVRDYGEDEAVFTTLESGSISLRHVGGDSGEIFLSPGHQSVFSHDDAVVEVREVNPHEVCGWRHGKFVFEEQKLSTIMRDLSRWYNFEYEFSDPEVGDMVFMGSIPRYADFATAAEILENSGVIRFDVVDSKVIILKK
ncbi:MAG: FecR domain-containing protein [Muribaculaceae bacterium]|nr:FecR domain-containing protein [Muribaculaceae bacterium]MDE6809666.1 FecR domain-containing protein [Muribaculaceae bacterium]